MEIKTVYAVYFSATGRTRKVVTTLANAIAQTLELPLETVDFTLPAAREETYAFTDKDLVIFGTPTYAGKVPNKLLPFAEVAAVVAAVHHAPARAGDLALVHRRAVGAVGTARLNVLAERISHVLSPLFLSFYYRLKRSIAPSFITARSCVTGWS